MKQCPYCNSQMGDDALFCSECGKMFPLSKVCSHCGATVNEEDLFCSNCGAKIDKNEDATHSNNEEYISEVIRDTQKVVEADTLKPIAPLPTQKETEYKKTVKGNSPKKYGKWIIISLIAIALIGGGVYFFLNRSSSEIEPKEEVVTNGSKSLHGSIGEHPITMELHIDNPNVDGSLYYNKYGPDNKLFVSGSMHNNKIELKEHNKDGMETGHYKGEFSNGVFQGEYVNYKGDAYSFKLSETEELMEETSLCPDGNHPHIIDLGLPSGTKWACCNVGASKPEDYGDMFAWGETSTKSNYDWSTYRWCNGSSNSLTKYNTKSYRGTVDNRTQLELSDDAARARWGGSWRMPTIAELTELKDNCTYEWTTIDGVKGGKFTSRVNGHSVFLPAAGFHSGLRSSASLSYRGEVGYYWSSSLGESGDFARYLIFTSRDTGMGDYGRNGGQSVRPVIGN